MDSRGRRQVAGGPASEPAVGVHPPRGAKLPARLPQPHLWLGRRGCTAGSAPVRPALGLTRSSSHHHAAEGLFLSEADLATLCGTSKSEERQANQTVLCFSWLSHSVCVFFLLFLSLDICIAASHFSVWEGKNLDAEPTERCSCFIKTRLRKNSHSWAAALPFISDSNISVVERLSRRISHERSHTRAVTINAFHLEFFIWVKQTRNDDKSGWFYDFMKQNWHNRSP